MQFAVLGPIEVRDGDRVIDIGPRMPKAVLAVLLLEPGRVVSLDRLIDLLWGDEPPAAATSALQVYISGLRRAFEPDRPARTPPRILVTQPPGYVLRVDPSTVDAIRFAELVAAGHASLGAGDAASARGSVETALALWRGTPYAELAFEPFLQVEIGRLNELHALAWDTLMEARLALGAHAATIAELERLAAEDPIRERRWELLALALYRDGRQAAALRTLQQARAVLAEELGIDPGPSLRRLEDDILQQSPSLELPSRAFAAPAGATASAGEKRQEQPTWPLVGRQRELAQLRPALDAVRAGRGRVALISGEPGIGKTRLVEELSEVASAQGLQVAWGSCYESDAAPAYWPWVQIVRSLAYQADPAAVRRALVTGAEELAQIVPDMKELAGRPLEPLILLQPEAARTRLYDSVTGFVLRLASQRPTVLVVDDLHWADAPSLQLLCLLAARVPEAPLLLACTYRDFDADLTDAVRGALGTLARVPELVRIRPARLSEADVGRLVWEGTGEEAGAEVSHVIRDRSEGNPFFVTELVKLLQSTRQLDAVTAEIPLGVRDVIRLRLARLPEESVSLLRLAAVAGRYFDLDVVAEVAGVDVDAALDSVEAAMLIGVVLEHPDTPGRYQFSHSVIRETLYQELSSARRARVHRALGHTLARAGEADAIEVAHHLFAAAPFGGYEEAFKWALRAADRASDLLAFEQVEEQLRRGLALTAQMPRGPGAKRRELNVQARLGTLLLMTRGYAAPEVGQAWSRAADLSREVGEGPELMTALWGAWSYACVHGEFEKTVTLAEELARRAAATGDLQFRLVAHHAGALSMWHVGRLAEARYHAGMLVKLCEDAPDDIFTGPLLDRDPRAYGNTIGGVLSCLCGSVGEGVGSLDHGLAAAHRNGRPFTMAVTHTVAALGRVITAERDAARACAAEAAVLATRHGFRQLLAMASVVRGWADDDAAALRAGLAEFEASGARMLLHFFLALLAEIEHRHGRHDEALACVERGLAESGSTGERFWLAELHRLRGELVLAGGGPGRSAAAAEAFEHALSVAREQGARLLEVRIADSLRRTFGVSR